MSRRSTIRFTRGGVLQSVGCIVFCLATLSFIGTAAQAYSGLLPVTSLEELASGREGGLLSRGSAGNAVDPMRVDRISRNRAVALAEDSGRLHPVEAGLFLSNRGRFDDVGVWPVGLQRDALEISDRGKPSLGNFSPPVPEPTSLILLGGGLIAFATVRTVGRRRRKA